MTILPKFTPGTTLSWDGRRLVYQQLLTGGALLLIDPRTGSNFLVHDEVTGQVRLPTASDLEQVLAADKLRIIRDRFGPRGESRPAPSPVDIDPAAIETMDRKARARRFWVRHFDEIPCALSDKALSRFIADNISAAREAGVEHAPSPSSLRRWINARGVPGERALSEMVSRSGRVPRKRGFAPVVEKAIKHTIAWYYATRGRTMIEAYAYLRALGDRMNGIRAAASARGSRPGHDLTTLRLPSLETLRSRINKAECLETITSKFGEQEARRRRLVPKKAIEAKRILDLCILDHSVVDSVLVVHGEQSLPMGRPTVGLLMDAGSRCVLAWIVTFEPPSIHTVTELIKRANRPKPHLAERFPKAPDGQHIFGRPGTLLMDKGIEGVGVSWRDSMADAAIGVRWTGVHEPQQKGFVERLIRTLNQLILHRLPGAVPFGPDMMRALGIDPSKDAVITLEELNELVEEAINLYHYQIHAGLNAQPIRIWMEQAQKYGVDVIDDVSRLDQMVGITKYPCTLSRNGVVVNGLRYRHHERVTELLDAMAPATPKRLRPKGSSTARVKVKFNPANLGEIHVFNERSKGYVTLPADQQAYANGLSLWQHNQLLKWAERANMAFGSEAERLAARLALRRSIERAAPDFKNRARKAAARLLSSPNFMGSTATDANAIAVAAAEPRHDGNGPALIAHRTGAETRRDNGRVVRTPQRGRAARQEKAGKVRSRAKSPTSPEPLPPASGEPLAFRSQPSALQLADLRALAKQGVAATIISGGTR